MDASYARCMLYGNRLAALVDEIFRGSFRIRRHFTGLEMSLDWHRLKWQCWDDGAAAFK